CKLNCSTSQRTATCSCVVPCTRWFATPQIHSRNCAFRSLRLLGSRPCKPHRKFRRTAERLNRMTDHLLDAPGQLVRSEKLASVGRLASGIAHEVGNPLGASGTYLEVLRRRGADPEVVAGLSRELERIDRIVRSLLDYARPQDEALGLVDTATVVRGAYVLLE